MGSLEKYRDRKKKKTIRRRIAKYESLAQKLKHNKFANEGNRDEL